MVVHYSVYVSLQMKVCDEGVFGQQGVDQVGDMEHDPHMDRVMAKNVVERNSHTVGSITF